LQITRRKERIKKDREAEAQVLARVLLHMAPADGTPFIYGRYQLRQDSDSNVEADPKEGFWTQVHENIKDLKEDSPGVVTLQKREWTGLQRLFSEMIEPENGLLAENVCDELSNLR
jgi:hypothetical protein